MRVRAAGAQGEACRARDTAESRPLVSPCWRAIVSHYAERSSIVETDLYEVTKDK